MFYLIIDKCTSFGEGEWFSFGSLAFGNKISSIFEPFGGIFNFIKCLDMFWERFIIFDGGYLLGRYMGDAGRIWIHFIFWGD